MAIPHARRMNLVALAFLLTALIAFVAFHFLVVEYESAKDEMGWEIWPSLFEFLRRADFSDFRGMIAAASFLCSTLLIVLAPLLLPLLKKSRLMWWVVVIPAGLATCGFGGIVSIDLLDSSNSFGPAVVCLLGAFFLNFIGLLFIRREAAPDPIGEVSP